MMRHMPTATNDLHRIAKLVRLKRAERGWGQIELARKARVARRTLQLVESGEHSARDFTYGRIARALEIPLSELIGEEV